MSQVDSFAAAGGLSGLATRQAFNTILDALATCSSGATAPNNPFAGMIWRDTSTSPAQFKIRNDANTAWVSALQAFGAAVQGETFLAATTKADQRTALGLGAAALKGVAETISGSSNVALDSAVAALRGESSTITASGTAIDFTGIPSGVNEIDVLFKGVGFSGSDTIAVRLSTGAVFATSGYIANGAAISTGSSGTVYSTISFPVPLSSSDFGGIMRLRRQPSTNNWLAMLGGRRGTGDAIAGGGEVAIGGTLDGIRITSLGGGTFNSGTVAIRWRF